MKLSKLKPIFNHSYPCYPSTQKKLYLATFFSIFIFAFLYYFRPFGLGLMPEFKLLVVSLLLGILCFITLSVNLFFVEPEVPRIFKISEWTVGVQGLWVLWNMVTVCMVYIISLSVSGLTEFNIGRIVKFVLYMFSVAVIPISLMILTDYLIFYKKNSRKADSLTRHLSDYKSPRQTVLISSENEREQLHLYLDELLYITGAGNYIEVYYQSDEAVKKTLLRGSLQKVEAVFSELPVERCHRSFIANLIQVIKVEGDAHGYNLHLRNTKKVIPVSRSYQKSIIKAIEHLNNSAI